MSRRLLPLLPAGLSVVQVLPAPDHVTIVTVPTSPRSACPLCGGLSGRVHSHYRRRLADLPWQGRRVAIRLRVRRFRCAVGDCPRRIFTERLPEVARPSARRSLRLADIQRHLGLALGGASGARLAARLAMPVSGNTLLRLVRAGAPRAHPAPRVIGIDEWSWRRGLSYGTILCDLERGRIIDLLPDRSADTVSAWLRRHPSVAVIARDRAGVFADAIRQGAPAAKQVADRWHLLRNLGDALRAAVGRHRKAVSAAAVVMEPVPHTRAPDQGSAPAATKLDALRRERREHRHDRYAAIRRWRDEGLPPRRIAPLVGMSRRSVERWLAAGGEPEHRRPPVASRVDAFRPHLERRWRAGCHNAAQLWREIAAQGFAGSPQTVTRWAAPRRGEDRSRPVAAAAQAASWRAPSRRRCAWLLGSEPDRLGPNERRFVARLAATAPPLAAAADLARRFAAMIRSGDAANFDAWLADAAEGELAVFAQGVVRDASAVRAAITEPWSNSPVEGQINRLKTIKRQMYGRAGYDLLRHRVLAAA